MAFSFAGGGLGSGDWCMMLTSIFCSFTQAGLEAAVGEKWYHPVGQCREAFHGLGVQDATGLNLIEAVFCMLGEE
jgi:hypothetical protein